MKFLFVLVQLGAAVLSLISMNEAKYTLLIVQHLLLFCSLGYFNSKYLFLI